MPSQTHEVLVRLFKTRPQMAPGLLREALGFELPEYTQIDVDSENITDVTPAEYRADLVLKLQRGEQVAMGLIVEVQLAPDDEKLFSWPAYGIGVRRRNRCPSCVLVVTTSEAVARWAAMPIDLGSGNMFRVQVLSPRAVPKVTTIARAEAEPELALLSAMAHGASENTSEAVEIAIAAMTASARLDPERSVLYFDLISASLGEATRNALKAMDLSKYEFQSEFAKHYISLGRAEGQALGRAEGQALGRAEGQALGRAEGQAEILSTLLASKFGELDDATIALIRGASARQIERWATRVLTATSLADALS
jgi:hypothetical protein